MGRSKVGTRPNEFKYGMALYGAAWPEGDHYYVCGGGGHGMKPRIVWAQYRNGRCSDQVGEYNLGKETPMRMLMCPWGTSLLLGNANGGIRRLAIGPSEPPSLAPSLVEVSAAFEDVMTGLTGEVGSLAFNRSGSLLGVGFKEAGGVKLIHYPSMKTLAAWTLSDPEVKDVDFAHVAQPGQPGTELLATVAGDGSCQVWQLSEAGPQVLATLEVPKGLARARFIRCRFARRGAQMLYVLINAGRDASYLAAFAPEGPGKPWSMLKKVKAKDQPASAMDISRGGEWIAAGFADGALRVFNSDTLLVKAEAEVSIAFVSHVAFNGDNTAAIAVGGDANCYVMELAPRPTDGGGCGSMLLVLLLLLLFTAGVVVHHFWQHPEQLPYSTLQQLQQWSQQQEVASVCSSGSLLSSFTSGGADDGAGSSSSSSGTPFPLEQQLVSHVCGWVQRAANVLPPDAPPFDDGRLHDEF